MLTFLSTGHGYGYQDLGLGSIFINVNENNEKRAASPILTFVFKPRGSRRGKRTTTKEILY